MQHISIFEILEVEKIKSKLFFLFENTENKKISNV